MLKHTPCLIAMNLLLQLYIYDEPFNMFSLERLPHQTEVERDLCWRRG